MKTHELIDNLSGDAASSRLDSPTFFAVRLAAIFIFYALVVQLFLGIRPDLMQQLSRPAFVMELALLAGLAVASAGAALFSMYPDTYQKAAWLSIPYLIFTALTALLFVQFAMPNHGAMMLPSEAESHGMECALCIASIALVPSALIFGLLRRGATIRPWQSGAYAVLTSFAIGCFTLRLAEANDEIMHLVIWHYIPTLLFAMLGAVFGKWWLKW